jgi:hypothetical protein
MLKTSKNDKGFTVKELIDELKSYPPDKKVEIFTMLPATEVKKIIEAKDSIILED